jgi:E3 ubiquitin-protein ligase HUWE1
MSDGSHSSGEIIESDDDIDDGEEPSDDEEVVHPDEIDPDDEQDDADGDIHGDADEEEEEEDPNDLERMELHFNEMDNFDEEEEMLDDAVINLPNPAARRRIMELDMGPDGLEIHFSGAHQRHSRDSDGLDRIGERQAVNDEVFMHPLLQQQAEPSFLARPRPEIRTGRSEDLLDWQAFDDAMGGNALQLLEQIFSRGRTSGSFRIVEIPNQLNSNAPGPIINSGSARVADVDPSSRAPTSEQVSDADQVPKDEERLAFLHNFKLASNVERWKQEMKLMYGKLCHEKSLRLLNALLNFLVPLAKIEDEKRKQKEEEERKKREEERKKEAEELQKKKDEEERLKKEELSKKLEENTGSEAHAGGESSTGVVSTQPAEDKVIVFVNGNPVDITGNIHYINLRFWYRRHVFGSIT